MSAPLACILWNSRFLRNVHKFSFARLTTFRQSACNAQPCVQRPHVSTVTSSCIAALEQQISHRLQPCRQYSSEVTHVQDHEIQEKDKVTQVQDHEVQENDKVPVDELDVLYQRVFVEVKGHDLQVMQSYRKFVYQTSKELDVWLYSFQMPKKYIEKRSLLRSVFIYKKHFTQYEMRTHYMVFEFKHLTGSTADTFLEYIQRNLPEGMAMKTTKHRLEKFPEDIQTHMSEKLNSES